MKKIALLLIALTALLAAAPASAAPFTPQLEADFAFAARWWSAQPTGCSSLTLEVRAPEQMENPGANGEATRPESGEVVPCILHIAWFPKQRPCERLEVVLHEYGHLLGFSHSSDPTSIMFPSLPGWICWRAVIAFRRHHLEATLAGCRAHSHPTLRQRRACHWKLTTRRMELREIRHIGPQGPQMPGLI